MATPYLWRQLTEEQREALLKWRKDRDHSWHWPPHRPDFGGSSFHLTAACYEHSPIIGESAERLENFSGDLAKTLESSGAELKAWCVLPNHYHVLISTPNVLKVLHEIGRFHGRIAHTWNSADESRGRKVFHGAVERALRSERHYWATINYIHHNPVHHGYARLWTDWPWSSAAEFLSSQGRTEAERIWKEFPIRKYGAGWDDAHL